MIYNELIAELEEIIEHLKTEYDLNDDVQPWAVTWLKVTALRAEGILDG